MKKYILPAFLLILFVGLTAWNLISGKVGVGTNNPTATFHVKGNIRFEDLDVFGGEVLGRVLIVDDSGYVTAVDMPTGGGGGGTTPSATISWKEHPSVSGRELTFLHAYKPGKMMLFHNGILLDESLYSETGAGKITLLFDPKHPSTLKATYPY